MTTGNNQDHLKPEPPGILQNLKWLKIYGWRYRWWVFWGAIVFVAILFGTSYLTQLTVPDEQGELSTRVEPDLSNEVEADPTHPTEKSPILTTGEAPDEILETLSDLVGSRRAERARQLYEGKWIPEPGWIGVVFGLPSRSGQRWFFSIKHLGEDGTESTHLTHLFTKQDAADLRHGVRVRVTGKIEKVSVLGLSLEQVGFEVVE